MPGTLITVEGIEGCGKSTQCARLAESLRRSGYEVVTAREPGNTATGEAIRAIVLHSQDPIDATTEIFLYMAARAQLVAELVQPALSRGAIVLLDRFLDSTVAYQGGGRGRSIEQIHLLNRIAIGGRFPDRTFLIDIDVDTALRRIGGRNPDRIEREPREFHERVRQVFRELGRQFPSRIVELDGACSIDEISQLISVNVQALLNQS